jgi:FkbM family methyltransferase
MVKVICRNYSYPGNHMLKRLIRDNDLVNPIVSKLLRFLSGHSSLFKKLTHLYRVYGEVTLNILDVRFRFFTKADDHIANEIFYQQGYEAEEFSLVKGIIASSRTFVDVGANTGIFSIFAAKVNPALKVLSFEPHPTNYARLQQNVALNQLNNVRTFPLALGQAETTIQFTIPADNSLSTTASVNEAFATHFHGVQQKKVDVSQVKLDSILSGENISHQDLIKIDVEYYELEVLKGATRVLSRIRPLLLVEILDYSALLNHAPKMRGTIDENHAKEILQVLEDLGYFPYGLSKDGIYAVENFLGAHDHRNFLFVPQRLSKKKYRFDELRAVFDELARPLN